MAPKDVRVLPDAPSPPSPPAEGSEKKAPIVQAFPSQAQVEAELNVTEEDLAEAQALADNMSLEDVRSLMTNVYLMHENDPNFPHLTLRKIRNFLDNPNILESPEKYADEIEEMKIEAALITNNSPYAEVRAVVKNTDDPSLPVSTVRAWTIGMGFTVLLAFINQLFSIRQPAIAVYPNVAQLLAFPLGKLWEKIVPDVALFGLRLNPGPFNKKEHMLITIMATVAYNTPYTDNIIWTQYMPQYFNQHFAGQFSYQILVALSTNLIGYGLAGLARRFLVYPAYCVWPTSLVTIALNEAFHSEESGPVRTPFGGFWRASRMRFFMLAFAAMFVYFWFPNYLFGALSVFNWMTWIAPDNLNLNVITGSVRGMGLNPFPTFDWNIVTFNVDPLMVPFFSTMNMAMGTLAGTFVALALWYTNTYYTAHLPINSNRAYDNTGSLYNITKIVDSHSIFDQEKYESYSRAYLCSGNMTVYIFFFAVYPAILVYIALNHRFEVVMGMRNATASAVALFKNVRARLGLGKADEADAAPTSGYSTYQDVHNRLMSRYPEVSELWYMAVLLVAIACGVAGIAGWQTYTTPGVVFYGIVLCLIFVIPCGIVTAMTGIEITLNVLAEFIGGTWSAGNALAMNYFKAYGYVTCAHAIRFSNDLKLAHYLKIPPRHTFAAQLIATVVSTFVCTGVLNFQMNQIEGVCTENAPNRFTCPGINTFFTAAVVWGTIGPTKVFGAGGQYTALLAAFPIGALVPVIFWYVQRRLRRGVDAAVAEADAARASALLRWARQAHPVAFIYGGLNLAPYNFSYMWPAVPVAFVSWIWIKTRWLAFWSRYNYVLSASFSCAIAIAGIVIFFALQYNDLELSWWGNDVSYQGCEGSACVLKPVPEGSHFGPGVGEFH